MIRYRRDYKKTKTIRGWLVDLRNLALGNISPTRVGRKLPPHGGAPSSLQLLPHPRIAYPLMVAWSSLRIHLGPGTFSVLKERLTMVPGTHFSLAYLLGISLIDWLFRNGYQTCSRSGRRHLPVKPSNGVTADQARPSYNDPELHLVCYN